MLCEVLYRCDVKGILLGVKFMQSQHDKSVEGISNLDWKYARVCNVPMAAKPLQSSEEGEDQNVKKGH